MHQSETLYNPALIGQLLRELLERGYFLIAEEEMNAVFLAWMLYMEPNWPHWSAADRAEKQLQAAPYQERIFTPDITKQLRHEVDQFNTHQQDTLHVYADAVTRTGPLCRFEFDLDLASQGNYLALNYTNDFFTTKRNESMRVEAFNHWLGIVELLYNLFQPIYAYAWNHNGSIPATDEEHLQQRKPYILYEINLFGPEMVENLGGREYLLKTPAQLVRPLSDGGVLIIPELPWYPGSLPYTWSKVAKYLDVVCPDFAVDEDEEDE